MSKIANRAAGAMATFVISLATLAPAAAEKRWYFTNFGGVMTENPWNEVFDPNRLAFANSGLIGLGLGWDRPIGNSKFSLGFEAQFVAHVGDQDHFEFNLPFVVRLSSPLKSVRSTSFGIGLSHATKPPQVEVNRKGASQRNLVYWMADIEFANHNPKISTYLRLHHRSDGYGFYKVDSGSTALVLGWRRKF